MNGRVGSLRCGAAVTTVWLALGITSGAAERPNIILIFADDLGYGDVGCYGSRLVPTPAIDSLARDGIRCTDGYVTAPVCAPSRCGIMTGAYNQRFGMQWNDDRKKYSVGQHQLLPQALQAAGYRTGHIGKWNIPVDARDCFHEVYDLIDWEADYFPDKNGHYVGVDSPTEFASSKVQGVWGPERKGEQYLTDRIGQHAVEFIQKHRQTPFFLYLAFNAVHSPWHAKRADRDRFAHIQPEPLNYYAAMIATMDENIGRVLAALKANGLEDDTLVAFTSDNGPALGSPRIVKWPDHWPAEILVGSAGPLNGHKGQFLEGGIREPFILRWPACFQAGTVYRQPVSTMDLYPTFLAAAGAAVPADTRLDGTNLLPYLFGKQQTAPHDMLFWRKDDQGAVRQSDWKLLISPTQPKLQLFNLAEDVGEKHDLATEQPQRVTQLHAAWLNWSAALPPRANPQAAASGNTSQSPGGQPRSANTEEGFVSLFDGQTLSGWTGAVDGYTVENGCIVCQTKGGGNLFTQREFADFVLRLEYKLPPNGNNGIGIRTPLDGRPAYEGMEIQILDDSGTKYTKLKPEQYNGSIYGAVAAKRGFLKPVGQWNEMEIRAQGPQIRVTLNGSVIVDADLSQLGSVTLRGKPMQGLLNPRGHIGLLGHGHRVEYRKLRIKTL